MFEEMHEDWEPYKEREDQALVLFREALALLKENKKNYFGLAMGDQKFAVMCHTKNKDGEFQAGMMNFESEETGKTFLALLELVEGVLERHGLITAIYEGHGFYHSLKGKTNNDE